MPSNSDKNTNRVIIAAAGSGKTTYLIHEALKISEKKILITTFTEANETEIRRKFIDKVGCVPPNIKIQTWFSFLLQHGIRPYQECLFKYDIKGMNLVGGRSAQYTNANDIAKHYFDGQYKIYSDKISKFLIKCNESSKGKVIDRLSKIYTCILIDEAQDLSGYDFEFLKLLFDSAIETVLVCDPRQGTYSTSNSAKNKKYSKSGILEFFENSSDQVDIDDKKLAVNYRSVSPICTLSNALYPDLQEIKSGNNILTGHDGVFMVRKKDVEMYLSEHTPMQLRDNRKTMTSAASPVMNFGASKGLTFERVLIYPTAPIRKWLKDRKSDLQPTSRSKLYVAITRASHSVAFVYDYKDGEDLADILEYRPNLANTGGMGQSRESENGHESGLVGQHGRIENQE